MEIKQLDARELLRELPTRRKSSSPPRERPCFSYPSSAANSRPPEGQGPRGDAPAGMRRRCTWHAPGVTDSLMPAPLAVIRTDETNVLLRAWHPQVVLVRATRPARRAPRWLALPAVLLLALTVGDAYASCAMCVCLWSEQREPSSGLGQKRSRSGPASPRRAVHVDDCESSVASIASRAKQDDSEAFLKNLLSSL